MHPVVEKILREQGKRGQIEVAPLPRMHAHHQRVRELRGESIPKNKLLYVTGSFRWHNLEAEHEMQVQDLRDITKFAAENTDWRVRVRIHPREDEGWYQEQSWPENVELTTVETSVPEDLAWASVLATARSTMAVEAELVGVPVLIYTRNFGQPSSQSIFAVNSNFQLSNELETVKALQEKGQSCITAERSEESQRVCQAILELYDA